MARLVRQSRDESTFGRIVGRNTDWFRAWLDEAAPPLRPVLLVGFSDGAAFAGGHFLDDPSIGKSPH